MKNIHLITIINFNTKRFNSSGTLLFSVGEDGKLFVIDVRLNDQVKNFILNIDQRLVTDYVKIVNFEIGFYLLGYIEFEGESVSLDVFDYEDESNKTNIISRVGLAIHDKTAWEVVRKNIQELIPNILSVNSPTISVSDSSSNKSSSVSNNNSQLSSAVNTSISQNVLFQNAQMETVINRSAYTNNTKDVNYDMKSTKKLVKLACKVIVFDINFNVFTDKTKIYSTKRLDFKDDVIMRTPFHSHFLFSSISFASRTQLVCATDRFLTKFNVPEYEANKKASKVCYLELNEIVGIHELGYSYLTRSYNNNFIAVGSYDGSISVRRANDLVSFNFFQIIL